MVAPLVTASTPERASSALITIPKGAIGEPAGDAGAGATKPRVASVKPSARMQSLCIYPPGRSQPQNMAAFSDSSTQFQISDALFRGSFGLPSRTDFQSVGLRRSYSRLREPRSIANRPAATLSYQEENPVRSKPAKEY